MERKFALVPDCDDVRHLSRRDFRASRSAHPPPPFPPRRCLTLWRQAKDDAKTPKPESLVEETFRHSLTAMSRKEEIHFDWDYKNARSKKQPAPGCM